MTISTDELAELLQNVELFDGLDDEQITRLAGLCREEVYGRGDLIFSQGQAGDTMYVVREGLVEIIIGHGSDEPDSPKSIICLGTGQVFGDMALVDRGLRSASVRSSADRTVLDSIHRDAFMQACATDTQLGFVVMRNLAADLSFRLRRSHLSRR